MPSVQELSQDQDFINLSAEAKKKVLLSIDPDFSRASPGAQDIIVSRLARNPTGAEVSQKKQGLLSRGLDALKVPAKMAESGLKEIVGGDPEASNLFLSQFGPGAFIPQSASLKAIEAFRSLPKDTGNVPYDVMRGTPKVIGETLSEVAPSFVSRASILGAGLGPLASGVSKAAKAVGPFIAKTISRTSGINPKALEAAAKNATTVFKPGIKSANETYGKLLKEVPVGTKPPLPPEGASASVVEGAKKAREAAVSLLKAAKGAGTTAGASNRRIVDNALYLAKRGELSPRLANVARKSLDALYDSKSISDDFINNARKVLSSIESQSSNIAKAKEIRGTAELAEQLRTLTPMTKTGGTGQFRTMIGGGAALKFPALAPILASIFSPAVQGGEAALAGLAVRRGLDPLAKSTASVRAALAAALSNLSNRRKQNGGK